MSASDPLDTIREVLETGKNVKFGRGVIGKTSHVAMITLGVWGTIVLKWTDNLTVDGGLLLLGFGATAFAMWWTKSSQAFAERNPAQAMLEGADFIEYHRLEMQAKGVTSPSSMVPVEVSTATARTNMIDAQS